MKLNTIYQGDALELSKQLSPNSINCIVTSPPYWNLRDYGVDGQLGNESSFDEYINKLCNIFDNLKTALTDDGTCWVNIGDTYCSKTDLNNGVYEKSLCMIPSRFAIEMCRRGWILRNEIIWYKKNVMPSSAKDRFTVDFEKVYFFSKSKSYHFEQIFEELAESSLKAKSYKLNQTDHEGAKKNAVNVQNMEERGNRFVPEQGRNKRCVWQVNPKSFKEAHFATYPEELIEPMIISGCPENGVVFDPFMGSGTTAYVSLLKNRNFIGFELNPEYIKIAEDRISHILNINSIIS